MTLYLPSPFKVCIQLHSIQSNLAFNFISNKLVEFKLKTKQKQKNVLRTYSKPDDVQGGGAPSLPSGSLHISMRI